MSSRYDDSRTSSSDTACGITLSELPSEAIPIMPRTGSQRREVKSIERSSSEPERRQYKRVSSAQSSVTPTFRAMITPLTSISTPYTGHNTMIEFSIRRKNSTVSLMWEPFEGVLGARGTKYLGVHQTLPLPPPYPLTFPIIISHNSKPKHSYLYLDPGNITPLMFYLDISGSGADIDINDTIEIKGSCISWLTNH